jgi:hypothetical protein
MYASGMYCELCSVMTESNPGQATVPSGVTSTCNRLILSIYSIYSTNLYILELEAQADKMQALKLSKKYPEFKQDEIFDLVNKFK